MTKTKLVLTLAAFFLIGAAPEVLENQPQEKKDSQKDDQARIRGTWKVITEERRGRVSYDHDHVGFYDYDFHIGEARFRYKLNPGKQPKEIDLEPVDSGKHGYGIYQFDGKKLKLCLRITNKEQRGKVRPTSFVSKSEGDDMLLVLQQSEYMKAEVRILQPGSSLRRNLPVEEPDKVAKLASFFPGMYRAKKSPKSGAWKAGAVIRFNPIGRVFDITIDSEFKIWSEGQGDWDLKPGLKKYLDELINDALTDTKILDRYPQSHAFKWIADWHRGVGDQEVRMSWFLHGEPGIAMVCSADLPKYSTTNSREVYDHASQCTETRRLSHCQVLNLQKIVKNLPLSGRKPDLKNLLIVSCIQRGRVKIYLYDRLSPPQEAIRLYDITGAYLETDPDH